MSNVFNDDYLQFRLIAEDFDEIDFERDRLFVTKLLEFRKNEFSANDVHNGIRSKLDENGSRYILCVICNIKLKNWGVVGSHLADDHKDLYELLHKTPIKPIVGINQIEEYINVEDKKPIEYKCNLCNLIYSPKTIFWHIVSFDHKENFFKTLYSIDFIDQIKDARLKHEKIDKALIAYEKEHPDRGKFQYKPFYNGMVVSNYGIKRTLNMTYIKRLFPQQFDRVRSLESKFLKVKLSFAIHIQSEKQFEQGKILLQKINQSLMEFQKKNDLKI